MTGERLRRSESPPRFVQKESGGSWRYPYRKTIDAHVIQYRRERWQVWAPDESEERPTLRMRETFGWILRDTARVGALHLREYDLCALDSNETLWLAADAARHDASQAVYALCSQWRDVGMSVAAYGSVLELCGLWLQPSARAVRVTELLNAFVQAAIRDCSICILKAFPLEYENRLGDQPALRAGFDRRMRAMQRHYARTAGMITFLGPTGEAGWMWKPAERVEAFIPTPTYSDEPFPEES